MLRLAAVAVAAALSAKGGGGGARAPLSDESVSPKLENELTQVKLGSKAKVATAAVAKGINQQSVTFSSSSIFAKAECGVLESQVTFRAYERRSWSNSPGALCLGADNPRPGPLCFGGRGCGGQDATDAEGQTSRVRIAISDVSVR